MSSIGQWKFATVMVVFVAIGFAFWASAQEKTPPTEVTPPAPEKTITITESQLNQLVERQIAQQMITEQKSLQDRILEGRNWHTAVFGEDVYTIYTGPGTVVAVSPYQPPPAAKKESE